MRRIAQYSFIITFIWLGFVLAISFMEAPVKFMAPSLTLPAGLDVGRHVFSMLNKIEIGFALISIILVFFSRIQIRIIIVLFFIILILIVQSFWLLPELSSRVEFYLTGQTPPASDSHLIYIVAEGIKVILIFFMGWFQIKNLTKDYFLDISRDKSFIPGNP